MARTEQGAIIASHTHSPLGILLSFRRDLRQRQVCVYFHGVMSFNLGRGREGVCGRAGWW